MKNSNLANEIAQMREVAQNDAELSAKNGIDLNPFSLPGSRNLWQSGWDGMRPRNLIDTSIDWRFWERGRQAKIVFKETEGPQLPPVAGPEPLKLCLHVTSAAAIKSIMNDCLRPQIGPMSKLMGEDYGIYMFPSWEALDDANWLEDWAHDGEMALLCVNVEHLNLESDVGYEVVSREQIHAARITVLAPGEENWQQAKETFLKMGGHLKSVDVQEELAGREAPALR